MTIMRVKRTSTLPTNTMESSPDDSFSLESAPFADPSSDDPYDTYNTPSKTYFKSLTSSSSSTSNSKFNKPGLTTFLMLLLAVLASFVIAFSFSLIFHQPKFPEIKDPRDVDFEKYIPTKQGYGGVAGLEGHAETEKLVEILHAINEEHKREKMMKRRKSGARGKKSASSGVGNKKSKDQGASRGKYKGTGRDGHMSLHDVAEEARIVAEVLHELEEEVETEEEMEEIMHELSLEDLGLFAAKAIKRLGIPLVEEDARVNDKNDQNIDDGDDDDDGGEDDDDAGEPESENTKAEPKRKQVKNEEGKEAPQPKKRQQQVVSEAKKDDTIKAKVVKQKFAEPAVAKKSDNSPVSEEKARKEEKAAPDTGKKGASKPLQRRRGKSYKAIPEPTRSQTKSKVRSEIWYEDEQDEDWD